MYPTNLAFNSAINCSNFKFQTKVNDVLQNVLVTKNTVLGTKSERLKENAMANLNKKALESLKDRSEPNIARLDVCFLPVNSQKLYINGNINFTNIFVNSCNDNDYRNDLNTFLSNIDRTDVIELSRRYFMNIVNGRLAQRNLSISEKTDVEITFNDAKYIFNTDNYLYSFNFDDLLQSENDINKAIAIEIVEAMTDAFLGKKRITSIQVSVILNIEPGQKVFPSQEFSEHKNDGDGTILAQENGVAILHSQKTGNAIRTIDNYFDNGSNVIPVEPYGSAVREYKVYRTSRKSTDLDAHLYAYLEDIKNINNNTNQSKFVIANLIRGGVFGGS